MRTYYRGPDALVTDELFLWSTHPQRAYIIGRLSHTGIVCDSRIDAKRRATLLVAPLLGGVLIYAGPLLGSPGLTLSAILALLLVVVAVAGAWRQPSRSWHLQADYQGRTTLIYSSTDVRVFNQVARALLRAIEDSRRQNASSLRTAAA